MGMRTGRPRGRPAGAKNKRTEEREAAVRAAAAFLEGTIDGAFEGDAHTFLIAVYKDPEMPLNVRVDAAKAAIGYEKPRLNASEHNLKSSDETICRMVKGIRWLHARNTVRRSLTTFGDWRWRLNNLYWITDKEGRRTKFQMNWAQEALFNEMHYLNVILKARQLGFTTFIQLFMLDACVFNSNIRAGTIAHRLDDAQAIFRDKVKFPYDNLPEVIRTAVPVVKDSVTELLLGNNSSIRVSTSHRSGTLNYLHISEYGKLCAKHPEKAREVRTGALNTVQQGQVAFIESTAEGQEGHYYELCQQAQAKARMCTTLTPLDFKFFFFPWWRNPEYELDPRWRHHSRSLCAVLRQVD